MTYARIPDFSQPAPIRRPTVIDTVRDLPSERRSPILPNEPMPGTIEPWEAVTPVRPDTAHIRARRFLDLASEALAAALIIAGGVFAFGYLPLA
ncbi:hypothetical protein [Methylobacterium radiotolerans]|uniref:hypothetical protein n=1 Tax=Methylobacterium radiotolerans TaxID=31998 RepID=UPI000D5F11CB|nr:MULTISPECIES: hypothetical protein [Methylobacterium]MDE3748592.1 hypothetical protein [Methylobacterium radiotolerans]PVY93691.1 hypothetical protein C7388_1337 [Methylobacterium organophilum]